ncbi:MAG: phosphate ABC transporter permease subunit PstC [Methylococcales bacterium]
MRQAMLVCTSRVGHAYVLLSTLLSMVVALTILFMLLAYSWDAIYQQGFNLFSSKWHPADGQFGIISMVYGSAMVTMVALIIVVPLGLATALFISEVLPPRHRFRVKSALELLAGIPSIVYGLIGVAFFSVWVGNWFTLSTGRTILTAAILLAIMILPTLITLSDDALHSVPRKYRETARGLGLYRHEVILNCVLPLAKADILGAVLLSLGRALGETMAVMLVIGSIDKIPQPFFNLLTPGQTVTSKLGREIAEAVFGSLHFSALIFMGLILLLIVMVLTGISQYYTKLAPRLYE